MYTLLLTVIYLAFISLGLPDSLLGSAWPVMRLEFGAPLPWAGAVSMIIAGGTILSSLLSERITRSFGTRAVPTVSVLLTAASLMGLSTASAFLMLCVWAVPYGLGAGAVDAALNHYVAMHYSSRHMSWLHSFWGVGAIISPYVMSWALGHATWQTGYRTVSFIQFSIMLVLVLSTPLWRIHREQDDLAAQRPVVGLVNAVRIRGVLRLLTGFFAYCGAEAITMLWTSSYLVAVRDVPPETAAAFASLFFIGMTAGRIFAGFITDKLGDQRLIRIGGSVAIIGTLMILLPFQSDVPALLGFVVVGLGSAPVYPSIIHATPGLFGADNAQAIIGIQMASAYTGSTFMPPLFGLLAGRFGLHLMPYVMLMFFVLMLYLTGTAFRTANREEKA
ncbi:MAG: MFS transporter [Clostridiales bacterium]|nr:MFS transporter [Clostridiales bacterium]